MDRFEYAFPTLEINEQRINCAKNIKLYDGDNKTTFEGGEAVLTSHRLWWVAPGVVENGLSCLSLDLSYIVFIEEETPSAFAFTRSRKLVLHLSQANPGKKRGPVSVSCNNFIKLSFKDGLEESFVLSFRNALSARKWETSPLQQANTSLPPKQIPIKPRTGIVGIERGMQEKQKATEENISIAFQDLSKLMDMAKDMVNLSKNISLKIREKQGCITEDETIQFKSYLLSLGIDDPVTRDSYSSESKYMTNLAREMTDILLQPLKDLGGMMSLADAYCRVNRARGLELLSPEDMLSAAKILEKLALPIRLRVFDSGVMVLQLTSHDDNAVVEDTTASVKINDSLSPAELSQALGISVLLAKERLTTTEKKGLICRDESIEGLRFYPNLFVERCNE
uniref:Vacuolar protein-sorting-associated protein 36 n=1 Tax=Panstrongylus lignarius TaxID=156445 RepID=A0A224XDV5_9HEMI